MSAEFQVSNDFTKTVTIKTTYGDLVVPCSVCTMPGFDGYEFALHKSITRDDCWVVAEKSLGMIVAKDESIDAALWFAADTLKRTGPEKFKTVMKNGKDALEAMLAKREQ